jgi:alpha-mannosidase
LTPIDATISQLGQLTRVDVRSRWSIHLGDLSASAALDPQLWQEWNPAQLNDRKHIAWPAGQQVLWLSQIVQIPITLQGYPLAGLTLRLALRWWAEQAEIYIDRKLEQVGDLFDCFGRIVLGDAVMPGDQIPVAMRLVSPGHDPGALVESQLIFEPANPDHPDPGMVGDELTVLKGYLQTFAPAELPALSAATAEIAWDLVADVEAFHQSLTALRLRLQPWQGWLQQRQIRWIGHAHLDLAWLWPVAETWEAAKRTFTSVLQLQADFPELIFCHSSPALYAWIEHHRPDLFTQIQAQVAAGRWEVAAGLWVEPELNLISGESLVRQVLYGQRYTQEKFGHLSAIAWLPDSFGFCWQLPQILRQGGIEYFVTQKLRWNDTTVFPHELFWWQAPDRTQILSVMLPPIGTSMDAVPMATYAQKWEAATGVPMSLWLPGVGDHGGGPTRDMLEVAQRWQHSSVFPKLQPTSVEQFCRQVEIDAKQIPIWSDELYLEYHRGCYTSHADQKAYNRRCEHRLVEAELYSTVAALVADLPYPEAELEQAWQQVLFNQFHDILPGSSIAQVFVEANQSWQAAEQTATESVERALGAIAASIDISSPPMPNSEAIVLFNSLNWPRTEVVAVPIPRQSESGDDWQILDAQGDVVQTQPSSEPETAVLLFEAMDVPPLGYQVYWLCPSPQLNAETGATPTLSVNSIPELREPPNHWILENHFLQVEVSPVTGDLLRVCDRLRHRDVLSGPGNQLQFFRDRGQYWDAWNIDPDYADQGLPGAALHSIQWISWGPIQQRLRVIRGMGQSRFCQDYVLNRASPVLRIETQVDWQDRQVLVKAAFPLAVTAGKATYEIPAGAIVRPTLPNPELEPKEQAKWEVPALHWADLTQDGDQAEQIYGVSLLNDCKYGYDAQPNQLRLTLLRSPNWPDPECDRGFHQFTYALYPHPGSWQAARTTHRGYELNRPLRVVMPKGTAGNSRPLPLQQSFGHWSAENVILMALKRSEDEPHQWILRCYECHGEAAQIEVQNSLNLEVRGAVDVLERSLTASMTEKIGPWKILSLVLEATRSAMSSQSDIQADSEGSEDRRI